MDAYDYAQTDREMLAKAEAEMLKVGDHATVRYGAFEGQTVYVARINWDTNEATVYLEGDFSSFRSSGLPFTKVLSCLDKVVK